MSSSFPVPQIGGKNTPRARNAQVGAVDPGGVIADGTSVTVNAQGVLSAIPGAIGEPPTGPAGGDLSGTYPNPGVNQVHGAAIPASATVTGTNAAGQLVNNSALIPTLAANNTYTGLETWSANGTTAQGSLTVAGQVATAAGAAPLVNLSAAGATVPTWGSGTILGINAPAGFAGNFIDVHLNGGGTFLSMNTTGQLTVSGQIVCSSCTYSIQVSNTSNTLTITSAGVISLRSSAAANGFIAWGPNVTQGSSDASIFRAGVGVLQIGLGTGAGAGGTLRLGQVQGASGAPAISPGVGAGSAPTVALTAGSNNLSGQVSVTTGTSPTASAIVVTVTWANAVTYAQGPFIALTPANAAAAALTAGAKIYVTTTTAAMILNAGSTALAASTVYLWNYHAID